MRSLALLVTIGGTFFDSCASTAQRVPTLPMTLSLSKIPSANADTLSVFISLDYKFRRFDSTQTDSYILPLTADIVGVHSPDDDSADTLRVTLGRIHMQRVQVERARDDKACLHAVFDSTKEMFDVMESLFNDIGSVAYTKLVDNMFPEAYSGDILLIDRFEIYPFARGQRLGLAVLRDAIRDWQSGCQLVVVKCFPLQFEAERGNERHRLKLGLDQFTTDEAVAFRRLSSFYKKVGFQRIGRTRYHALCPNEQWDILDPDDLPTEILVPRSVMSPWALDMDE